MRLRGRCTGPLDPRLPGAQRDDDGRVFITGRHVVRNAGESAVMEDRFFTCPWALARAVQQEIAMHRRVRAGDCSLTEYLHGDPTDAAFEAMDVLDIELPKVRKAVKEEKDEATNGR